MGKMKRRGKFCLSLLVLSLSFQSVFATSLVTTSTMKEAANEIANEYTKENEMLDTFIKAESVTPSQLQLAEEIKSNKTTPAIMDVEANFTAIVRSGKFAEKTASNGDSYMPRERLDAKTTKTDNNGHRKGYMMFSIPRDIDWDATNNISLKLFVKERMGKDAEDTINFYITETPKVSEENMTWNNSPSIKEDRIVGKITLEQGSDITKNRWVDVDLTEGIKNYCQEEQNSSTETNLSLTLCMSDPTPSDQGGVQFYSKYQDSGKYTPYLTLSTEGYKDTLPPKVIVTGLKANQEVVEEVLNFKVEAKDNYDNRPEVYISLNGTEQKGLLGENKISLQQGNNLVQVIVRDAEGNEAKTEIYDVSYFKGNTFTSVGDTFTRKDDSDKNFGTVKELLLKNPNNQGTDRRVYLNFDLENYKKPYIREAKIYLYMNKIMGNDRTYQDVEIFETPTFDEKTLTWNNAPISKEVYLGKERMDRSKVPGSTSEVAVNAYYPLDITKYINSKLLKGETLGTLSFALRAEPNDQTGWFVASREEGQNKAPYINLVEGLPDPDLCVKGIAENAIYSDNQIEDVEIKIGSVDSSIKLSLEAEVNGESIKLIPKENGFYDIPLTQIGENTLKIKVTDEVGNINVQTYHVTKLVYLEANTYYIDSIAGNDNYDGLSVDKPWKTLDKLNTLDFKPGTKLLFKRGSVWDGQFKPKGSGTKDKPITVGSYGKGSRPILNGNGISSKETGTAFSEATVQLEGVSYWEVNDLEITNKGYVAKGDTSVRRSGILVLSAGKGDINHIYIKNCYVHDINVDCATSRNYKPYNGGILFVGDTRDTLGNDTKVISGFNDVLVEDCHIKDVEIEGLRLVNRLNGGDQRNPKTNHDVVFRNNLIEEIHGDGIVVSGVASGGLVEKNIIRKHSKCQVQLNYAGCWVIYSNGVVFQYNEVYDGVHGYNDGEAFDFDMGAPNTVFQYNYSHNNKGGFLLTMSTAGANNIFRYNISQNDGNGNEIFFCANKYDEAWIYNNTIYVGKGMQIPYLIEENNLDHVNFKNNIVYAEGEIQNFSKVSNEYPGKFENNCIYPASILSLKGAPSNTKSNITVNPLLTDPSGTNIKMDTWDEAIWHANIAKFKLQPGSPCIDAGQKIPNAPEYDIYGTSLDHDGTVDIGAYEYREEPKIQVEAIKLSDTSLELTEKSTHQLLVEIIPEEAVNKEVSFTSNNLEVVKVEPNGLIRANKEGKAVITVRALENDIKANCEITVIKQEENQTSSSSGSKKKHKPKTNPELKEDPVSQTVKEQWEKLDKNTKNQIQEKLNKELPYTVLAESYDIKALDELTQHQFTEKQLQAIQKDMYLLRELGLSISSEVVVLKPAEKVNFKDISPTYWANDAIQRLAKLGIVKGFEDGTFRPDEALRIEDAFSFLDRVLLLNGLTESTLSKDKVEKYITDKDNFAYHEKLSIGSKLTESTLKKVAQLKDETLSRSLVAEVLYEITNAKLDKVKELTVFKDIDTNEYKEALAYCFETGLLYGTSDKLMSPDKDLTRAELMAILERLNILLSNK